MGKKSRRAGVHTAVVLPADLLDQFRKSETGVSDEIRRRLKWTTDLEPLDVPTRELIEAIALMAQDVESETGDVWHAHAGSHAAFRQAILSRLARLKPEGPTEFGSRPNRTGAADDPQEIGIWIEHDVWRTSGWTREAREKLRTETAKTFQEILKLHRANESGKGGQS